MSIEQIRELRHDEISQVADLHLRSGIGDVPCESNRLCDYYRTTFLEGPWCNPALPSLVCCDDKNQIIGFIGVLSRQMSYDKKPVTVAVAHRFMVDSRQASSMLAIRLMRRFLSGPQELSISDGANDQGKKFWLGCGGQISWLYSIDWFKPILPISYFVSAASRKNHRWLKGFLPAYNWIDRAGLALFKRSVPRMSDGLKKERLAPELLLDCIQQFAAEKPLMPKYTVDELLWLYCYMAANTVRGKLEGWLWKDQNDKKAGCCLYYVKKDGIAEIMLLCSSKNREAQIYHRLIDELKENDAIAAIGRMDPDFMQAFGEDKVMFKRGCWAMIHSRRPELMESINSGNAFFSKLEGELCLYAPSHIR